MTDAQSNTINVGDNVSFIKEKYKDLNGVVLQIDKTNKAIIQFIHNNSIWREVVSLDLLKIINGN